MKLVERFDPEGGKNPKGSGDRMDIARAPEIGADNG